MDLYELLQPWARLVKTFVQMAIGVLLCGWVVAKMVLAVRTGQLGENVTPDSLARDVLEGTGLGLAVSAAIELAYTLFTDGPDEALNPLLLGASASLTLFIGKLNPDNNSGLWLVGITGLLLLGLFAARKYLATDVPEKWPLVPKWWGRLTKRFHARWPRRPREGAIDGTSHCSGA